MKSSSIGSKISDYCKMSRVKIALSSHKTGSLKGDIYQLRPYLESL
jgi:hypothetical protein